MHINPEKILKKLYWSQLPNGNWKKSNTVEMSAEDAMGFELTRLIAFERSVFVCPDCGYKILPTEYIDEEFYSVLEEDNSEFYSDGSTRVDRYTLVKEGFTPVHIRRIHGEWQMRAYISGNGDERWQTLNVGEDVVLKNIEMYGEKQ